MFSPKKILVPTDFSKFSDEALKVAIEIAKQHGSKIYLLHVIDIIRQCTMEFCIDKATEKQLLKDGTIKAKELFGKEMDTLPTSKEVEIITDVRTGTPYDEILKDQTKRKIDLIVIATHGKTGLLHHLMGSVAERVTKGSKCSVLLIRN